MILDCFFIQVIVCFIVDCSGFIQEMEGRLGRWLGCKVLIPKPFSCSLCLGLWINICYLLIISELSIETLLVVALFSFFSRNITGILIFVRDFLFKVEGWLYRMIKK